MERDVLDKAENGDAVFPGVIGSEIGMANLGRHGPPRAAVLSGASAEGVQAARENRPQERRAKNPQGPWQSLALGQMECGRVQHDQPFDSLRPTRGKAHADHPTPIVQHQGQLSVDAQMMQ